MCIVIVLVQHHLSLLRFLQVYTNEGMVTHGRTAIVQRLQEMAQLHAAFGSGTHQADIIDSLPMQVRACAGMCLPASPPRNTVQETPLRFGAPSSLQRTQPPSQ